jgi:hypothetical protein
MRARRRLVPLLTALALTLPAVPAHAQGAGDDQYQDPFGSSGSTTRKPPSSSAPARQVAQAQTQPGLSQKPPASSAPSPAATAPAQTQVPSATALPRTGMEIPGMALLGLGLLVSGVGLRLRTLDESLF